jgi:uncharacterized delta-60 repeat protein
MTVNTAPAFSMGPGRVSTDLGANDTGSGIVVQADGKILMAGTSNGDFALVRFNADGTVDATFGVGGKVITNFAAGDVVAGLALQADGKIVVAGTAFNGQNKDFAVTRYNTDGSLDTTFDGDGKLTTAVRSVDDAATGVVVQPDGKIVVVGTSYDIGVLSQPEIIGRIQSTRDDIAVVRYNPDGTLDTTFSGDGKDTRSIGTGESQFNNSGNYDIAGGVALGTNGAIYVAASADVYQQQHNMLTVGFGSAGGSGGNSSASVPDSNGFDERGQAVATRADGTVFLVGYGYTASGNGYDFLVAGSGFSGGYVRTDFGGGLDFGEAIAIQGDGKVIAAGYVDWGSGAVRRYDFVLARYNADGSLDTTFDGDGKVRTGFGGDGMAASMVILPDGRILVGGTRTIGSRSDFALARYNADGSLDSTFSVPDTLNGTVTYMVGGPAVVLDRDVVIDDAELTAQLGYTGASVSLVRHGGASAQDVFSATGNLRALTQGSALVISNFTVGTVTTNSGGVLVLTFNDSAYQARVNDVLQSIAYSNSGPRSVSVVQLDWTFSDGNAAGAQGTGGPLSVTSSSFVNVTGGAPPVSGHSAAVEFNGDARADVLWHNDDGRVDIWQMNGPQIASVGHFDPIPRDWRIVEAHGDFNGDGRADIVWRNTDGRMDVWQMNGTLIDAASSFVRPSNWLVLDAHADYNGDRRSDILWRDRNSGQVEFWQMNGLQVAASGSIAVPTNWTIVDMHADFNGDGKSDLLWRNRDNGEVDVWLMNGVSIGHGAKVLDVPLDWTIVDAQGDYNGDGKSDILWRNSVDGRVDMWLMNGAGVASGEHLPTVPLDWTIVDAHGDYNGDGKSDILWRNELGARVDVWQMDGAGIAASSSFGGVPGVWTVMDGHSDYNGDGRGDVLWRSTADGQVALWTMNGTQRTADVILSVPAEWHMQDTAGMGARVFGDTRNETLFGTDSADTFEPGGGQDTVTGGGGADRILLAATPNGANVVSVTDFHSGSDQLNLSEILFPAVPAGPLSASNFVAEAGAAAHDANDHLLYDTGTGTLSYDGDGTGAGAAVVIAILANHPLLAATDIQVGLI